MRISAAAFLFEAKLLPSHPDFGKVDTVIYGHAYITASGSAEKDYENFLGVLKLTHLLLSKVTDRREFVADYPTGNPEQDSALKRLIDYGCHFQTGRTLLKPDLN